MNEVAFEFIAFAKRLAENESDYEAWQKYAVAHYEDEQLESARREIVRICNSDESIGNSIWPLTERAAKEVNKLVESLEAYYS